MLYTVCTSHKPEDTCKRNIFASHLYTFHSARNTFVICHRVLQSISAICVWQIKNGEPCWTRTSLTHKITSCPLTLKCSWAMMFALLVCALSKVHTPKLFLDLLAQQQGRAHDRCGRLQNSRAEGRSPIKETYHFAAPSSRSWSSTSPRAISSRSPGISARPNVCVKVTTWHKRQRIHSPAQRGEDRTNISWGGPSERRSTKRSWSCATSSHFGRPKKSCAINWYRCIYCQPPGHPSRTTSAYSYWSPPGVRSVPAEHDESGGYQATSHPIHYHWPTHRRLTHHSKRKKTNTDIFCWGEMPIACQGYMKTLDIWWKIPTRLQRQTPIPIPPISPNLDGP